MVIERCDISDWGSIEDDGWGNRGSAIYSLSTKLKRIIVQRNKMHHPYSNSNSWSEYRAKYDSYHPRGPRPIGFVNSAGNAEYEKHTAEQRHAMVKAIAVEWLGPRLGKHWLDHPGMTVVGS